MKSTGKNKSIELYREKTWLKTCIEGILFVSEGIVKSREISSALETLAIISYRQPVTRTQIAEVRGVRTDSVILTLSDKGLIKEAGKLKEPGSPMTYKVADTFLEILGIDSLKDLPPLKDFDESNE